jgi:hypothetical protein
MNEVSTHDVARQAVDRLAARAAAAEASLAEVTRVTCELQDQLRELLSYCQTQAEAFDPDDQIDEFNPYDDVTVKLREILDGE